MMRMESLKQRKLPIIADDIEICWKKHKLNVHRQLSRPVSQSVGDSSAASPEIYWNG